MKNSSTDLHYYFFILSNIGTGLGFLLGLYRLFYGIFVGTRCLTTATGEFEITGIVSESLLFSSGSSVNENDKSDLFLTGDSIYGVELVLANYFVSSVTNLIVLSVSLTKLPRNSATDPKIEVTASSTA